MHRRNSKIKRVQAPARDTNKNWSDYQEKVFDHVAHEEGHGVVIAAPGSGKTTTIVEALHRIPKQEQCLNLAFNKSIADELMLRVPLGTKARTFHYVGLETVRNNWGQKYDLKGRDCIDTDDQALNALISKFVGVSDESVKLRESLVWAVKMAKTMLADNIPSIESVCCEFGIPSCGLNPADFAEIVFKILEITKAEPLILNSRRAISFDDMLWLPHVHEWVPEQYDRVFVDEAQDLSASRVSLALKSMKSNARLCAVLDPKQRLYAFAGADSGVINTLVDDMQAKRLALSVSYRCPKKVVDLARDINTEIEAAPNAIDGTINYCTPEDLYQSIIPGKSCILSRTNFPLVSTAFDLIKRGIKASIIGKDIGNRFLWRIDNWGSNSVQQLQSDVLSWRDEYLDRNTGNNERIQDEASSILRFTENAHSIYEVKSRIKEFFSDDRNAQVKLSTAHKAKGLEFDHVFLLQKTFKPGKSDDEDCIYYVALTRCKQSLTFVA